MVDRWRGCKKSSRIREKDRLDTQMVGKIILKIITSQHRGERERVGWL